MQSELAGLMETFVRAGMRDVNETRVAAGRLAQWLRARQSDWAARQFSTEQAQAVRRAIVSDAASGRMNDFNAAEQVVLALESISYSLNDWDRVSAAMDRMFDEVADDASFVPASFARTAASVQGQF